ncbi:hypothetical protein CLOM_g23893 [Closterium sp. NIES-68]|nr:hypothetical protein CLOM_g23893 [Closterium sp. NIES-68]GJP83800.1 hypothetical protein CLOP_g13905 [Closterium sp. NIES-67]
MVALACTCVAILIAFRHVLMHLRYYTEPTHQRYIIRIIFMVPVYAAMSYAALAADDYAMYFKTVRDVYEAWVIYNFLSLCLAWVGGPGAVAISLTGRVLKPSALLLTCWLPPIPLDGHFIRHCKRGCLQFVFIKPLLAVLCLILYSTGCYEEGVFALTNGYPYVTCVYLVSYSVAVYSLLFFYFGCHDLLRSFNPIPKFVMIKAVVVLTYWQGIVVFFAGHLGLVHSASDAADLQNLLLCCEMALAAGGFVWAFPFTPFMAASMGGAGGGIAEEVGGFLQRLRHAAAMGDVVNDTVHQFSPTYHDYVLYSDGSTEPKHFRTRTFVPMGREMEAYRKDGKINSIQSPDYILTPPPPLQPFHCKPCAAASTSTAGIPFSTAGSPGGRTAGSTGGVAISVQPADTSRTTMGDPFREITNSTGTLGPATVASAAGAAGTGAASNTVTQLPSATVLLQFLAGSGSRGDGEECTGWHQTVQPGTGHIGSDTCGSTYSSTNESTQTARGSTATNSYGEDMQALSRVVPTSGEMSRWSREGGRRTGLFERLSEDHGCGGDGDGGAGGGGGGVGSGVSGVSRRASRSGRNEMEKRESRSGSMHRHSSTSSRSSEGASDRAALYNNHRDSSEGGGSRGKGRRGEKGHEGGEGRENAKGRRTGPWSGHGLIKVLTRGSMEVGLVVDEEDLMEEGDARRELEGTVQR